MKPIRLIRSRTLVLPQEDVDTDQIIPARFLTTTERDGLGRHAFADWKRGTASALASALDDPRARGAEVLVAGRNFGCGSSREHAAWALLDRGFRAVLSTELADIFRANALQNGLLAVEVDRATHRALIEHPWCEVEIDLERERIRAPGVLETSFEIDHFARRCLLEGVDELGYLLHSTEAIERFEGARR